MSSQTNSEDNGESGCEKDKEVKLKTTGVGSIFNYIKENMKTIEEETKPDQNSTMWAKDVPLDVLCDIGSTPKKLKVQRVSSYFCEVCNIDLNSQVTYDTHIAGVKHLKKERNLKQLSDVSAEEVVVKPISAKRQKKGVTTSNIRKLIEETADPIVGLQYLKEVFPKSGAGEHEAMYKCDLCCSTGPCASSFSHIVGFKHKEKYLTMKYNLINLDKNQINIEAKAIEDKEGKQLDVIKTIFSDTEYPWPPGKKPKFSKTDEVSSKSLLDNKSREENGDHREDTISFTRRGYNFAKHAQHDGRTSLGDSKVAYLLNSLQLCQVKTEDDAHMAHQVSANLVKALAEYKLSTGDPGVTRQVQSKCEEILNLIYEINKVPSHAIPSTPAESGEWKGNVVDYGHGRERAQPSANVSSRDSYNGYSSSYEDDLFYSRQYPANKRSHRDAQLNSSYQRYEHSMSYE